MRLIDADECTSVEMLSAFPVFEESGANVVDLKELIASCKTVDVVPAVHGKWIESWEDIRCSRCGQAALYYRQSDMQCKSQFCTHCGARMDLK